MGRWGGPLSISRLESFVAESELQRGACVHVLPEPTGKKVLLSGQDLAGLTALADLAKLGYHVTIFRGSSIRSRVLLYGNPEFRLRKKIVQEDRSNNKSGRGRRVRLRRRRYYVGTNW